MTDRRAIEGAFAQIGIPWEVWTDARFREELAEDQRPLASAKEYAEELWMRHGIAEGPEPYEMLLVNGSDWWVFDADGRCMGRKSEEDFWGRADERDAAGIER